VEGRLGPSRGKKMSRRREKDKWTRAEMPFTTRLRKAIRSNRRRRPERAVRQRAALAAYYQAMKAGEKDEKSLIDRLTREYQTGILMTSDKGDTNGRDTLHS
jgi:hypothetical protein